MKKSYIYIVLILISAMVFAGCSTSDSGEEGDMSEKTFTLEELSEYDGS